MNRKIENLKNFRVFLADRIGGLSAEQLNKIPAGYNNSIIWNIAHLTAAAQNICYVRAGLPVTIDEKYFAPFMPGTRPERDLDRDEIETVKELFITSTDRFQADYEKGIFGNYTKSPRILEVYNVHLDTIDDAIEFMHYHEGVHSGCIMSIKKLL